MTYIHTLRYQSVFFLLALLFANGGQASKQGGQFSIPQDDENQTTMIKQSASPQTKQTTPSQPKFSPKGENVLNKNNDKETADLAESHPSSPSLKNTKTIAKEEIKEETKKKSRWEQLQEKARQSAVPIYYDPATLEKIKTGEASRERSQVTIINNNNGEVYIRQ
jgi:hypothetical protein